MTKDEALKMALHVLERLQADFPCKSGAALIAIIKEVLAQPEQEPVAWISKHGVVYPLDAKDEVNPINELQPLYTTPTKRKEWVGLTDDEVDLMSSKFEPQHMLAFHSGMYMAQNILKEKNT